MLMKTHRSFEFVLPSYTNVQATKDSLYHYQNLTRGPCGRAVKGVGLRPLAFWDYGFESHRRIEVCLLWVSCVVWFSSLHRAYSSRGVPPLAVCLSTIVKHSITRRPWRTRELLRRGRKTKSDQVPRTIYEILRSVITNCLPTSFILGSNSIQAKLFSTTCLCLRFNVLWSTNN